MTQAEEQSQAALAEGAKWVSRMRDHPELYQPRVDLPASRVWTPPTNPPMMPSPYPPPTGSATPGLETQAWRLAGEWLQHLVAGDKVALYAAGEPGWTPGYYRPQQSHVQGIYWMSRLA
jgi:hypothetical protein